MDVEPIPVDLCHHALDSAGVTLTAEQKTQLEEAWAAQLKKRRRVSKSPGRGERCG